MAARAYLQFDPHARTRVLERVAAGAWLKEACGEAGAPCYESVHAWAKADPGFGAALALARAQGDWRRRGLPDPAKAAEILARLRAEEPIAAILRDPGMPTWPVYRYWRSADPEFGGEVWRLNRETRARVQHRGGTRRRFDRALADRIVARVAMGRPLSQVLAADPALPWMGVVRRWRREDAEFDFALGVATRGMLRLRFRARLCTPAMIEAVSDRVVDGETLAQVGARPWAPCAATLYVWMQRRPAFREAVVTAWRARADRLADQVADIAEDRATLWGRGPEIAALKRKVERLDARVGRWARG